MEMLTQLATSVRLKLGEEGMVIWYDSVTVKVIIFRNSHHMVVFTSFKGLKTCVRLAQREFNALNSWEVFFATISS